jgi:gliding motility-associated-like protein
MKHTDNIFYYKNHSLVFTIISWLVIYASCFAQEPVHNYGNLKIHETGALGFHHDFINDGFTDDNQGLVGFFSDNSILVSGAFRPIFNDMEVMVANDLFLEVGIGITNNSNFILGDVVTPRNSIDINLDYFNESFYTNDVDLRKIDGYSALTNKQNFTFPIGYGDRLRELTLNSAQIISNAKSAYFYEDPNSPSSYASNFVTSQKTDILNTVSTYEFWHLDSSELSWVNLKWDTQSNLAEFVDEVQNLRVVGWHTTNEIWENLGGININGDLSSGQITSETFLPDAYSILTFGSSISTNNIDLGNYLLTPNNDGNNDFLEIQAVALSPKNELNIYNRWGRLVYTQEDYSNTFSGKANVSKVVNKNKDLPAGVYFYIINLKDIQKRHQGFLYINQ